MEKDGNRDFFLDCFVWFCNSVELNDHFLDSLRNHRTFSRNMRTVDSIPDEYPKKVFIFLEFTRTRSSCKEIIRFLRESQSEPNLIAAQYLDGCNTSNGTQRLDSVVLAKSSKTGSLIYDMDQNPRGVCVIINNVVGELSYESLRFKTVFEELYFDVDLRYNMNTNAIREGLLGLSQNRDLQNHNALVVMIIAHGENENICGSDVSDSMPISDVVNIFAENNCKYLERKPKLFFFTCCRNVNAMNNLQNSMQTTRELLPLTSEKEIPKKSDTFVCYSSSEGEKSHFVSQRMTIFGEALMYSINQYSGQKSLTEIFSRTCQLMDELLPQYKGLKSTPQLNGFAMKRQLYFNPGFPPLKS